MKEYLENLSKKIQDIYSELYDHKAPLSHWTKVIAIVISIYYLINAYVNYTINYFIKKELILLVIVLIIYLVAIAFHKLLGKWFIHEKKKRLTREYIKEKMPRSIKFDGNRGAGKDSTNNAIRKVFQEDIEETIKEELETIKMVCYAYDFEKADKELDLYSDALLTNSKNEFFDTFKKILVVNDYFIKKYYLSDETLASHLENFEQIKSDPFNEKYKKIDFIYNDGITPQHFISLFIKYAIGYIRINYLDHFIISNQPMLETKDKPAKMFSTRFTNIQNEDTEWPWPIDGNFILIETEADAFNPNVNVPKKEQPMKSGLRNFKAFFRHFFGEKAVWITIGQRAGRTHKQLRELDHSFISIIEQSKVYGGEKRIWLLNKIMTWSKFWAKHSKRLKSKEKQLRRISKIYQLMIRLENSGYIYSDINVYRDDRGGKAEEISLKSVLKHDKKIFSNYKIKLCFNIHDCYFGYSTSYIEALAEILANRSNTNLKEVRSWSKDLIMRKGDMEYMGYGVYKDMLDTKTKKQKENKKKEVKSNEKSKKKTSAQESIMQAIKAVVHEKKEQEKNT